MSTLRGLIAVVVALLSVSCGTNSASALISNGTLALWSRGVSADPDGWARVGEIGQVERVPASRTPGGFAAKYTRVDANVNAFQELAGYQNSEAVTCSAWVAADKKQVARLVVDDGTTFSTSSWNQTAGTTESLEVTHVVRPGITHLRLVLDVSGETPRLTVPGTSAAFEEIACRSVAPTLLERLAGWNASFRFYDRGLEVLIALSCALGVLAWFRLRREMQSSAESRDKAVASAPDSLT